MNNILPFNVNYDDIEIYKLLSRANGAISELKGMLRLLPNPHIILSLIRISESKNSSEIENIYTTYDEIYKGLIVNEIKEQHTKEVIQYKKAIEYASDFVKEKGFISSNLIIAIQKKIEPGKGGIRRVPGTVIKNMATGEIVHTPPASEEEIRSLLKNLEDYINNDEIQALDPLIKVALIHFQFESIHPFYDGNGRTGRIINIIYLLLKNKIDYPVVYLSKYIIENKNEYYTLLKESNKDIEVTKEFIKYFLLGLEQTSIETIELINTINNLMELTRREIKEKLPKIYKAEIVEHIFTNMYTKNELYREEIKVSRNKATSDLRQLTEAGFLVSEKVGKETIYKNIQLFNIIK